jgi:outer membrane protein
MLNLRILSKLTVALILLAGWVTVQAVELKMGYVNAARLLEEAPQAELATKRLKQEFAPREDDIVAVQRDLSQMEEELRRNGDVMTEMQRRNMERDIVASKRELRRIQDEFREDLNFRRNEEIGKLQELVKQVIERMGKEEDYDLILFEGIAFANKKIDLTDKILERLNEEMKSAQAPIEN